MTRRAPATATEASWRPRIPTSPCPGFAPVGSTRSPVVRAKTAFPARIRTNRTHRQGSCIRTSSPECSKNETNRTDGDAVADPVGCTPAAERGQSKASVARAHNLSVRKSSFSVLPGVNRGKPGSGAAMVYPRRLTSGGVAVHVGRLRGHTRVRSRGHSGRVASWSSPSRLS